MSIYRGYNVVLEDGVWTIYKDGHRVYRLVTTNTEEAAFNWIDAEKKRAAK